MGYVSPTTRAPVIFEISCPKTRPTAEKAAKHKRHGSARHLCPRQKRRLAFKRRNVQYGTLRKTNMTACCVNATWVESSLGTPSPESPRHLGACTPSPAPCFLRDQSSNPSHTPTQTARVRVAARPGEARVARGSTGSPRGTQAR